MSSSLTDNYFRVLDDLTLMATLSPYNCDPNDYGTPEEQPVGVDVYYAQTNGRIGEIINCALMTF
jgi:hypothetical protein